MHRKPSRHILLRIVMCAAALVGITGSVPATAVRVATASCQHAKGPFSVHGARVSQANGKRYVPYGIVITGLGNQNWKARHASDDARINAALAWCSNSVRIQALQDGLVNHRTYAVSPVFLAALEHEVSTALSLGLVVIINDQGEGAFLGGKTHEVMPNKQSRVFWKTVARVYGNNPQVVFDLFNEPRHILHSTTVQEWNRWQYGGRWGGETWMGMQPLARYVRSLHVNNLFIAEGPSTAGTLQRVLSHRITRAGPVEYAVNHAGPVTAPHTPAYWDSKFGNAARTVPVTDTEWTNYASATRMCWPDAPTTVPAWLRYLTRHHIGLMAWNLSAGVLITGSDLTNPTRIRANWACRDGLDEGAGHQIMTYFRKANS